MAKAIDTLLADADLRRRYELAGRQRMEDIFCWQRAAGQMLDYYEQVLRSENG